MSFSSAGEGGTEGPNTPGSYVSLLPTSPGSQVAGLHTGETGVGAAGGQGPARDLESRLLADGHVQEDDEIDEEVNGKNGKSRRRRGRSQEGAGGMGVNGDKFAPLEKPSVCSWQWFKTDVLLIFPNAGYEQTFLYYYLVKNNKKLIGVTVICALLGVITTAVAIVYELSAGVGVASTFEQHTLSERLGLYGGLICYLFSAIASRIEWCQRRWTVISVCVMVVFAICRVGADYLNQYGSDDHLCVAVVNMSELSPDGVLRSPKMINLTAGVAMYAGGYQKGQGDAGIAFLPMWLVFFGPIFRHLFVVSLLVCAVNVTVFPITGCPQLIGVVAYTVAVTWIVVSYIVLLFLFWAWEWHMRQAYHLENVLAEENLDLGHVANPFSADSLKDWIRRKQLSVAQRAPTFSFVLTQPGEPAGGVIVGKRKTFSGHRQSVNSRASTAGIVARSDGTSHLYGTMQETNQESVAINIGGGQESKRESLSPRAGSHPSSSWHHSHRAPTQPWDLDSKQLNIIRKVAAGSGGLVYEAEYRGERVAMKESLSQLFKIEEVAELSREISMLYKARHPNIVQFLGLCFIKARRSIAIVVEWCPETLTAWMEHVQEQKDQRTDVLDKAQEIAVGMRYLHEDCHITHRDLKPANVLIGTKGMAKICDFGLATTVTGGREDVDSMDADAPPAEVQGTPGYIAPESFHPPSAPVMGIGGAIGIGIDGAGDPGLHYAVDVYSFGIILFQLLTFGNVAPFDLSQFECAPSKAARLLVESGHRPDLTQINSSLIPAELIALAQECWAEEPQLRPSFSYIVDVLERQLRVMHSHIEKERTWSRDTTATDRTV